MNYRVEDLSSLTHADDLLSGFIDPDDITYGVDGTKIEKIPTRFDNEGMPDLPASMKTSSSDGGGFSMDNVDPELINAAISTTGTIIGMAANSSKKTELEQHLKSVCGSRPLIGKGRKEAYRACATEALQTLMGYGAGGARGSQNYGQSGSGSYPPPRQGMSTGAVLGIVGGVVALGVVVVLVTRPKAS